MVIDLVQFLDVLYSKTSYYFVLYIFFFILLFDNDI